jgi:uncharacterized protein
METDKKGKILRIYVSSTDIVKHNSVYETVVCEAKDFGLAGATVYKGIMGYGASSELHTERLWEMTEKIPVVIEIIDEEEKINLFIEKIRPWLETLPKGCLVTSSPTDIIMSHKGQKK